MIFYSVQLRKKVDVPESNVQEITMKNGKAAYTATFEENGKTYKLFRIKGNK